MYMYMLASYPAFMDALKERLVSAVRTCAKFSQKSGKTMLFWYSSVYGLHTNNRVILVFFHIMATCSDNDDEFSSALVLRIIYTSEGYTDWKPWRDDCVVIVLLFTPWPVVLRDAVLHVIENNKYGCVIMQNNMEQSK